jgi:CrcB protein
MIKLFVIGLGGFCGAIARYGLSGLVHRFSNASFPTGTLAVNVLGCFVFGVLACLVQERQFFTENTRMLLLVGLLGSFTTFSTVGYETFGYLRDNDYWSAAVNASANMFLGVAAVAIGWIGVKALGV